MGEPSSRQGFGALSRAGLGICAAAAALAAAAPLFGDLLRGPDRATGRPRVVVFDEWFPVAVAVCAVVLIGAASVPRLSAGVAGVAVGALAAFLAGAHLGQARLSRDFAAEAELTLLGGGQAVVVAATAGLAGIVVALVGIRRDPPPSGTAEAAAPGDAPPRTAPKAVAGLALGVAGILLGLLAPLAILFGTLALSEIRASAGRLRGEGVAIAAIAVGIVVFSLYITILAFGMLAAVPPD